MHESIEPLLADPRAQDEPRTKPDRHPDPLHTPTSLPDVDLGSWLQAADSLPMHGVLGLVDRLFDLVVDLVDHLVDFVLRVVDLLFGLTRAPISLAFGFEVLVACEDCSGLLGVALDLVRLGAHRVPPFLVAYPQPL